MQSKTVTQNTIYLTISYVAQKVLSFLYFVLLARYLGVENLGKYTFALSFTTMWAVFIDIGLTPALVKEVARSFEDTKKQLLAVISVKLGLSVIVYAMVIVTINLMGYPALTKQLVYLSGLIMALDAITQSLWGVLRGARNLKFEGQGIVINQLLVLIGGFVFLQWKLPLIYIMLPLLAGSLFNLAYSTFMVKTKLVLNGRYAFDWSMVKRMLRLAWPFALLTILSRVYGNADSVLLSYILKSSGDYAVGIYAAAMKIPFALQFIPSAFSAAIFPAFSHYFLHDKKQLSYVFEKSFYFLTILVLPIIFGIFVLAEKIVPMVFGADFMLSVLPLRILIISLLFVFWNFLLGALLNGTDHQWKNTLFVGVAMGFSVMLNALLIPHYDYLAAAAIFVVGQTGISIASIVVARKVGEFAWGKMIIQFGRLLASSILMAVVVWCLKEFLPLGLTIAGGVITYGVALIITRSFSLADIKEFKNAIVNRNS